MKRRVVITGVGGVTVLGNDWSTIRANMQAGNSGIRYMKEWERYTAIHTRLGAPILDFSVDAFYSRKSLRTMGNVARMAVYSTQRALTDAGLLNDKILQSGRTGIAYGSSFGSPDAVLGFFELKMNGFSKHLNATNYIRMMSHTTAVNISIFFGITGRLIPTSSACTSGSQGIGYGYEAICWNKADIMICGGAEELDITDSATFDTLFATSTKNDTPQKTPRPYDRDRDGLVIGEGGATLILEEYEHAKARGATIYAEIIGFACNTDGCHATQPQISTIQRVLELALDDAQIPANSIDFISGHGTATELGDIAETQATYQLFGSHVPIHSLKGFFGHTLGACGAIETWLSIKMMQDNLFYPTMNLEHIDERCGNLDYIMTTPRYINANYIMLNNFAFGGINTSIIIKKI